MVPFGIRVVEAKHLRGPEYPMSARTAGDHPDYGARSYPRKGGGGGGPEPAIDLREFRDLGALVVRPARPMAERRIRRIRRLGWRVTTGRAL